MIRVLQWFAGRFGRSGALGVDSGEQRSGPSETLVSGSGAVGEDGALQISSVWAAVQLIAWTVASLPLFVYRTDAQGRREVERLARLAQVLHDSPNSRMTPWEFWSAMLVGLLLRGNAYARVDRDARGEVVALWPMPSGQVQPWVLDDGSLVYLYTVGDERAALAESSVLHIKGLGNGLTGLDRLEFMRTTLSEARSAQDLLSRTFRDGGKPGGVLMIDRVLNEEQRAAVRRNFRSIVEGTDRLLLLEADMRFNQMTMTPAEIQLMESRRLTIEDIGRFFGVPAVLLNQANVTTWGSGIYELVEGFVRFNLGPLTVAMQQAIRKRVLSPRERSLYTVEFALEALLRASVEKRFEVYAKAVQNGLKTRNEIRQFENDPPLPGGDVLTAQLNLVPLEMLGKVNVKGLEDVPKEPVAQ